MAWAWCARTELMNQIHSNHNDYEIHAGLKFKSILSVFFQRNAMLHGWQSGWRASGYHG